MRRTVVLALTALLLAPAGATAGNPWRLRCAATPRERPAPAALRGAVRAFWPWERTGPEPALHAGPVWLLAGSSRTAISRDGDDMDARGYYLHRALLAVAPSFRGAVTVAGRRLGAPGPRTLLGFSTNGAARCRAVGSVDVSCAWRPLRFAPELRIAAGRGWRVVRTELRIGRTGCFGIAVHGSGLRSTIPLAVPGPDWGTPGW
jgi:hypothetical protein